MKDETLMRALERLPRALLVDLDGTLADSHFALRRCLDDFLADYGISGTDDLFASLDGAPPTTIVSDLQRRYNVPSAAPVLLESYLAALDRAYMDVRPAEGAETLLRTASELGMTVVLVTSAPSRLARAFLETCGLESAFQAVISGDMGPTKPDPEPYRQAIRLAHVHPRAALALEDASSGVAAASSAGIRVIGVAASPDRAAELKRAGAATTVSTLMEVELALRSVREEAS
jgi:sugar-phosphatase